MTYDHCRAQKGGFFKDAASEGIAILFPDTSPRGAGIEGEDDDWVRIQPDLSLIVYHTSHLIHVVTGLWHRRRLLPRCYQPQVLKELQHAHTRHQGAPSSPRKR